MGSPVSKRKTRRTSASRKKAGAKKSAQGLLVEILTEELPPKSLKYLSEVFAERILNGLSRAQFKQRLGRQFLGEDFYQQTLSAFFRACFFAARRSTPGLALRNRATHGLSFVPWFKHRKSQGFARRVIALRHQPRERTYPANIGRAFGGGDGAARVQKIKRMRALHHHFEPRQR